MANTINLYNATDIKRLGKRVAKLYNIPQRNGYYNISAAVIKALEVAVAAKDGNRAAQNAQAQEEHNNVHS